MNNNFMNNNNYFMNSNSNDEKESISTFFARNALQNIVEVIISREDYNRYVGTQHYQDYANSLYANGNMIIKGYGDETLSLMIFGSYGVALESAITILKLTRAEKYTVNFYAQSNFHFFHQFYFDSNPITDENVPDITRSDGTFDSYKSTEILQNRMMTNDDSSSAQKPIRVYDPMKKIPNFDLKFGAVVKVLIKDLEEYSSLYLLNKSQFNKLYNRYGLVVTTKTDAGEFRLVTCYDSTIWLFDGISQRLMKFNDCRKTNTDKPLITSKDIKLHSIFVGSSYKEAIDSLKTDKRIAIYIGEISDYTDPEFGQGYLIKIENAEIACLAIVTSIANIISQKLHKKPLDYSLFISQIENGRLKVDDEMYIELYTEIYNVE